MIRKILPNLRVAAVICASVLSGSASAANDMYVGDKGTGCKVFRPNVQANESVSWTGKCLGEMADGPGTAQWSIAGKPTLSFSGTFRNGRLQGKGTMSAAGGDRYEGDYKDGMRDGKGSYVSASGERYEGAYKNNQRDGPGVLTDAQGRRTEGVFKAGVMLSQQSAAKSVTAVPSLGSAQSQSASPTASATTTQAAASGGAAKIGQETRTASGALFRVDDCGGMYQGVLGVPPKSLDLRTSTQSKNYSDAEATGGIFPIVREAIAFFLSVCKQRPGYRVDPPRHIFLFLDGLPPPGGIGKAITEGTQLVKVTWAGGDSWFVLNGPADLIKKVDAQKRNQEAAQQKQAQATAQRDQRDAKLAAFLRQHGAVEIPLTGILQSNPFSLEGKTIAITVDFESMNSPTVGMFTVLAHSLRDWAGTAVVSDIPKGTFLQPTRAFLAAKVVGLIPVQGLGTAPHLKYVGVVICSNPNTSCP